MADFIHSILQTNGAISADGDVVYDLPVNPLSVILLHVSPLNETSTIGNQALLEGLLSAVDSVRVSHKGTSVIDMNGVDLAAVALLWHRLSLWQSNAVETDNDRRSLVLPVIFGRRAYDVNECFPETRKGELQLTVTWDIADTGFDGLRVSIETVELPGATPTFVQKATTLAQTLAATGQNDIDLPIGNVIRAILMFGTTGYAGATPAPTLGQLSVFKDNKQIGYSATDFEVLRGVFSLRGVAFPPDGRHIHSVNAAGAGREDTETAEIGASIDDNYCLLDFDPLGDDSFVLETEGSGRVHVRLDAEAANAVRAIPIERVAATEFLE
ncbi:MAG: hypothetical protein ACE5HE_12470 [Phycisphaerae bacterium]